MSDYNKSTNFTTKDTLPTGNSQKIVKGTELDVEFTNISSAIASKSNSDSPVFTGTPLAPTATAGSNTTQIATCAFVLANSVPTGFIGMWSGTIATIPSGWYLCNGSNGTPDLRDKFIVGASSDETSLAKTNITGALTQTGGSKDAVVVSHTHTATVTDPSHRHDHILMQSNTIGGAGTPSGWAINGGDTGLGNNPTGYATTGISVSNSTTGVTGTNANLPPYYALAFIMKS